LPSISVGGLINPRLDQFERLELSQSQPNDFSGFAIRR